ncbi:class I SAM-dependent methyltransferase [Roseivivax lentus]|uniref:class I SAM-dependent methyltransferase n=1 Tax=Roseivivax lentus TaxID=633194 RepID=UPI002E0DF29F
MKILVAIANYGDSNTSYVQTLIDTYRGFSRYQVDIVILSNVDKNFGTSIEVAVGLPTSNPWSLPFAHRQIFADRQDDYDVFIYSEDDTHILETHVENYLGAEAVLPPDHVAGFMRHEIDASGAWHYSTVHATYHWDPSSVLLAGGEVFANFTNEHSAAYILSRDKLKRCIASGGFLVQPHSGRYDMLCSAATDPYTRCGLKKVINVSRLSDFSLHHLPNKYIGRIGLPKVEMDLQIEKLLTIPKNDHLRTSLIDGTVKSDHSSRYDRSYFTPAFASVARAMPNRRCRVLSVGCDMGKTEAALVAQGHEVDAIPLDHVIAESAKSRDIMILDAALSDPISAFQPGRYDVLLMNLCLPYMSSPIDMLRSFSPALSRDGQLLVAFWNWSAESEKRKRREEKKKFGPLTVGEYAESGIHRTDPQIVRDWLKQAGYGAFSTYFDVPEKHRLLSNLCLKLMDSRIAVTGTVRATAVQ